LEVLKDASSAKGQVVHDKRFRDYCDQLPHRQVDEGLHAILNTLAMFQRRQKERDPVKAKYRRRYVCGLREISKYISTDAAKVLIVARNLDPNPVPGAHVPEAARHLSVSSPGDATILAARMQVESMRPCTSS
jgi:hypothetical protein